MENTSENLEHIDHTQHAAHADQFNRMVAMSMAIIAALLAAVTMLSHRAHNATLRLQSEANIMQTRASDQWSYYQAKNIRDHAYKANLAMLAILSKSPESDEKQQKTVADWSDKVAKYKDELPEHKKHAEEMERESEQLRKEGEHAHHRGDRFDLAELGAELGLVLCSLAVLTKRKPFWIAGIVSAVVGAIIAASVIFVN